MPNYYPPPINAGGGSGTVTLPIAESDVTSLVSDLALKAPLASPTFTGTPSLPTGTTASTQSAADSTTKLATTAFATTADNLKANLASPTFTGTPVLPTGTTGTTQSAADGSTKLATTAYTDTADALKANLASPTFTGTPVLPTGTTGTTQSATDGSTKLATTAYTDTADALKANLASPTFTGTPTLPTGTILTTQTTGDSSTKGASTAFVQATVANGETVFFSDGTFMPFPMASVNSSGAAVSANNAARSCRFVCPKTGTLANLAIFLTASSGNIDVGIYDTNDAAAGSRTKIWTAGSTAAGTANNYQSFTPSVAMVAGRQYDFMISADNTTAAFAKIVGLPNVNMGNLPVAFNVVAGGATAKQYGIATSQFPLSTTTIAEASVTTGGIGFWFVGKIT